MAEAPRITWPRGFGVGFSRRDLLHACAQMGLASVLMARVQIRLPKRLTLDMFSRVSWDLCKFGRLVGWLVARHQRVPRLWPGKSPKRGQELGYSHLRMPLTNSVQFSSKALPRSKGDLHAFTWRPLCRSFLGSIL